MPPSTTFLTPSPVPVSANHPNHSKCSRRLSNPPKMQADTNPFDDTFYLSSEDIARVAPTKPTIRKNLSVAEGRAQIKQIERQKSTILDETEQDRRGIVDEEISASDLFGIIDTSAETNDDTPSISTISNISVKPSKFSKSPKPKRKPRDPIKPITTEIPKRSITRTSPAQAMIKAGDLVMHTRHGIGRFQGLERNRASVSAADPVETPIQEFAIIEYRDGDVYVPLSNMEMIRPLDSQEASHVTRLDTISGSATYPGSAPAKNKRSSYNGRKKTRANIRKQLVNLHGLYAQRTFMEREPFPIDIKAEEEFSSTCSFTLTEDQNTATTHILRDMSENRQPMDRLLCGDVGFGKTEVAIRAAFRALNSGKQVAILAPTTILAQQHYETFRDRFEKAYPQFKIACLTRFIPRKKVIESREGIERGDYQIAIGTHMLLNDSFSFHNLGLLIVDEEHRFGVNQKEKMRARYRAVDTLFLSATPIPRTLHLTLSGLRDASVLRTPPEGRKPVITRVSPSGSGVLREAIQREVDRDGQVFFVVPRIEGIEASGQWIQDLFPNLRVQIAHGSISNLEQRIWSFARREFDVLVCTTIIENGINMPDVNTVIVQDAGRFGLAQLHQLRGRVGRSHIQAYAYFFYSVQQGGQAVPSYDRLKALEKHSNLGSGFAIAQRDMEMRGVGTILGVEQHGNSSVGAEEYARILAEELEYARTGEPIPHTLPSTDTIEIFLPVASLIPPEYISNFDEKMNAYERLSCAKTTSALRKVVRELEYQYGPLPATTKRHICMLELKIYGRQLGITRIMAERQHVVMEWTIEEEAFKCLTAFLSEENSRMRCEHLVMEEKVVIRGLGICNGDIQLAKLRIFLRVFSKAAAGFAKPRNQNDSDALVQTLYGISTKGE